MRSRAVMLADLFLEARCRRAAARSSGRHRDCWAGERRWRRPGRSARRRSASFPNWRNGPDKNQHALARASAVGHARHSRHGCAASGPSRSNLSRCAYSATVRPRLSHMLRRMASLSASVFSGKAASRFSRARSGHAACGRKMLRPIQPPSAEAASRPRTRNKPMKSEEQRRFRAIAQLRPKVRDGLGSCWSRAKPAVQQPVKQRGPAASSARSKRGLDFQHRDARAVPASRRTKSFSVVTSSASAGARLQSGDLAGLDRDDGRRRIACPSRSRPPLSASRTNFSGRPMPAKAKTRLPRKRRASGTSRARSTGPAIALADPACRRPSRSPHRRGQALAPPVRARARPGSSGHCRSRFRHPPPPATGPCQGEILMAVIHHDHVGALRVRPAWRPAARSRATMVGAVRASSRASSPTCAGAAGRSPAAGPRSLPP